jgi:hypothetical protein
LPSFNDYSELKKSFSIVCSKLKPGTYNLIFYFDVKLASYSISPAYYRINAKEFVHNNKLTVGYVEVFRLKLDTLFYLDIYLGLLSDKVNKSSEVLLIIEAVDNANQSGDALMVEDEFYEPERAVAVAYGSSVTKGRSTTINSCPNTITNHVRLGNNLPHFTRTRKMNFCIFLIDISCAALFFFLRGCAERHPNKLGSRLGMAKNRACWTALPGEGWTYIN